MSPIPIKANKQHNVVLSEKENPTLRLLLRTSMYTLVFIPIIIKTITIFYRKENRWIQKQTIP